MNAQFIPSRLTDAFGKAGIGWPFWLLNGYASSHREAPFIAGQARVI
jgi:hypothetical protein